METNVRDGAWGSVIKKYWPQSTLIGFEEDTKIPRPMGYDYYIKQSLLNTKHERRNALDLIICNPPLSQFTAYAEFCLRHLSSHGVMLSILPISALESRKRHAFFQNNRLYQLHVLATRPSFKTNKRQGRVGYGLFIWQKDLFGFLEGDRIFSIDWEENKNGM